MTDTGIYQWEDLLDQLRPLGQKMRERIPERLRDDPQVMQESLRLLLSGVLRTTNDAIMHDRSHPIFVPELNICQNIFQPNADTIYKAALIEKGGTYRIRGDRGTTRMMILAQLGPDTLRTGQHHPAQDANDFDDLKIAADGGFDVILSPSRPEGHAGDWWELKPETEKLMLRIVGCDWGIEREPRLGIVRLDAAQASKGRPTLAQLAHRFAEIPGTAAVCALAFPDKVQKLRDEGLINTLKVVDFSQMSGLARQSYYEGAYDLAEDEALVTEVRIPKEVDYWSLILTNELYETTDWYHNQSSLNAAQAVIDGDGVFRAVISARDPGVHNWLDTSGYPRGAVQGRWFNTEERPTPTIRKVKLSEVNAHLPADTVRVTPEQRAEAIRERTLRAHMRVIW
ncbi:MULTISPECIES: DUF1214 domain-containing protein [Novosphingobium]|uniref:DUF1214 domain-containing protein n=1 Tax=Novosphingobium TaxID=165696 RepID=UPI0022F276C3|nr:DUF1214 domain-containing protein [Novosphingobium resinovorum]GLK45502.1 hypothetical protein GCM10017612_34220 [Novosphingobium resinovorum]